MRTGNHSKSREPFVGFRAIDAKLLMRGMKINSIKDQSKVLHCNSSYWSLILSNASSEVINDKLGIHLLGRLNKEYQLFDESPRGIIYQLMITKYGLDNFQQTELRHDKTHNSAVNMLKKTHASLLGIQSIYEPLTKSQVKELKVLSGLAVGNILNIFGYGNLNGGERKHSDLARYFYGQDDMLMSSEKSARLWFGFALYLGLIDLDKLKSKVEQLIKASKGRE